MTKIEVFHAFYDILLVLDEGKVVIFHCLKYKSPKILWHCHCLHYRLYRLLYRVLEWGDGYYNGDIKTRKTVQAIELNADQMGLQRSEQLRELYESLSAGEASPQARRPSASLSPEDLADTEWYYLVCMSFVFNVGQG